MKTEVLLNFRMVGTHHYPNAPKAVRFLAADHRHVFHFKIGIVVTDANREREIFIETDRMRSVLAAMYGFDPLEGLQFCARSCEMVALDIIEWYKQQHPDITLSYVEILEDGDGGARVTL